MRQLAFPRRRLRFALDTSRLSSSRVLPLADSLLLAAFVLDLFVSFLVWKGYLPEMVTSLEQILVAAAVAFAYTRMMALDRIPSAVWGLLWLSVLGITVAVFRGQGIVSTLWGWWLLFKYPLVGIYAFVRWRWPDDFSETVIKLCAGLVAFEAVFQVGQYLTGQEIGDNLAGTFGWHGVGHILFLSALGLSMAFGLWLAERRWVPLLVVLASASVSNVLAENKIFPAAALAMAVLAMALSVGRRGQLWRVFLVGVLLVAGVYVFSVAYNELVPGADRRPIQSLFAEEETRTYYLNKVKRSQTAEQRTYNLGRNVAVEYALSTLSGDSVTLAFGFGLGARGQSGALGVSGAALQRDQFDRGSQLVVIVQEMGLFGLLAVGAFTLWVSYALLRDIRRYPQSPARALRYGLFLFSVLWPVWLWYKTPLGADVAMLIYWISLGYVLSEPHLDDADEKVQVLSVSWPRKQRSSVQ
jgi:hypothetical protein